MTSVTVRAPAKINLHLGVGAPREDGYHPLVTVYQAVGLYDDVTARASADWRLALRLPDWMERNDVPLNGENIVDRAADLLAAHHGVERVGEVHLAKEIPVAGGMAGGSADAAAALVALDRLWQVRTSDDDLLELAAQRGSDVPFALLGGTALGTGRGELVTPVNDANTWWWVVVPSEVGLSTPDVYRHFDRMFPDAPAQPVPADALLGAIAAGDAWALADALHNDLEAPAVDLRPELGTLIETGEAAGALRGMVSGSGPTCVFLCGSADHARSLATDLAGSGHPVVLAANGPVAGAHLVSYA
jgi:4-diphosphocytidyl-2-C-methyl-D-erythritol kinase